MMRKFLVLLLCCGFLISFSACSTPDTNDEDSLMALEEEGDEFSDEEGEEEESTADGSEVEADEEEGAIEEDEFLAEEEGEVEDESEGFEEFDEEEEGEEVAGDEGIEDEEPLEEELAEEEPLEEEPFEEEMAEEEPLEEEATQEEQLVAEEELEQAPEGEEFSGAEEAGAEEAAVMAGDSVNIKNIEYLANQEGGTVVVQTTGPVDFTTRTNPETQQFILEIPQSVLPDRLQRPYILKEFEGEFASINAYQEGGSDTARVVIQLKNGGEPTVRQEGNSLIVIPPGGITMAGGVTGDEGDGGGSDEDGGTETAASDGDAWKESYDQERASKSKILSARTIDEFLLGSNEFFGKPISIQTSDANIREVISFIAAESGANIVVSDDVKGKLTIKLREVPWDQVLVIVMRAKNLGYVRQGSVLRISTLAKLRQETDDASRILTTQQSLVPLKVKVFPVSYASVTEMSKKLQPFLTQKRGRVVDDVRTSTIIVTDTEEVLNRVGLLIKELDIPPAQVMIEGKIIEASEDFKKRVGLNWSTTGTDITLSEDGGFGGGPVNLNPGLRFNNFPTEQVQTATGSLGFSLGVLEGVGTLNATLALAQSDSMIKIISSPRVVTTNKVRAMVLQKGEVLSKTSIVSNGTVSNLLERHDVELKLEVTPQITTAGSVIMDVFIRREFPGPIEDQASLARAINSREANTQVLVKNGQTAVIAGIFQSDENEASDGVPGLKSVPVIGWLFKGQSNERSKSELMIFLTPRILRTTVDEFKKKDIEIEGGDDGIDDGGEEAVTGEAFKWPQVKRFSSAQS